MGCGGSKEEVATGNTVSTSQLFQKKSSTANSTSSLTTNNSSIDKSLSSTQPNAEITEASDGASEKAIEEEKLTPEEPSDQNSSSNKEEEIIEMKAIPEEVEVHLPNEGFDEKKEVKNDGDEEGLKENREAKDKQNTEALDKKDETPVKADVKEEDGKEEDGKNTPNSFDNTIFPLMNNATAIHEPTFTNYFLLLFISFFSYL